MAAFDAASRRLPRTMSSAFGSVGKTELSIT
jgi:hypothetical protein